MRYHQKANHITTEKFHSKPTQVYWTCKALLDGRIISHRTEISGVRGWRLGAIIHRLKANYAWLIHTTYSTPDNVVFYSLKEDTDSTALRLPPSASALGQREGAQCMSASS